jgi:plastocyanin
MVTWTNNDSVRHNVVSVSDYLAGSWSHGPVFVPGLRTRAA